MPNIWSTKHFGRFRYVSIVHIIQVWWQHTTDTKGFRLPKNMCWNWLCKFLHWRSWHMWNTQYCHSQMVSLLRTQIAHLRIFFCKDVWSKLLHKSCCRTIFQYCSTINKFYLAYLIAYIIVDYILNWSYKLSSHTQGYQKIEYINI
jgi:hypothetical protein